MAWISWELHELRDYALRQAKIAGERCSLPDMVLNTQGAAANLACHLAYQDMANAISMALGRVEGEAAPQAPKPAAKITTWPMPPRIRRKWEYLEAKETDQVQFDTLGAGGWEMVGMAGNGWAWFKREVIE